MNFCLTILFFFFTPLIFGQTNPVANPSFEQFINCPTSISMLPSDWYTCSGTPDYYNACAPAGACSVPYNSYGYLLAADGVGYCGFASISFASLPYYKEYIGSQLLYPLVIGQKYFISFKVCAAYGSGFEMAANNIGLLFSMKSYQANPWDNWNIPTVNFAHVVDTSIIQNSVNWTTIKGSIIADSAYQYVLIGNFFDSIHTKTICFSPYPGQNVAYYFVDKVCVSTDSLTCNFTEAINENYFKNDFDIFPNPATNLLTIDLTIPDKYVFELYDLLGIKRFSARLDNNSKTVDLTSVDSGVYVFTIVDSKGDIIKTDKLIIIK